MQDTSRAPAGPLVVGERVPSTPYRVVGVVGETNAGSVFEVEHVELGKRFVLKALPPEAARFDTVARLRNEWRALARLAHPNIVAVSDAGTTPDGLPFFVMERLDGESLRARLMREGRLRASEAIGIAAGVAAALGAAHRIGIVHRDLKPESIFVTRSGHAKLLDFGLAKLHTARSSLTKTGIAIGTPRYMAPEQALGERVDHRADFYALGLVLFEMLTGTAPFDDAEDSGAGLLQRTTSAAPTLAMCAAGLPGDLDALVARMLARDPGQRPPDARSIAEALRQIGSRMLAPVSHDSPTYDARYSARTRPTVVPRADAPATTRPTVVPRAEAPATTRRDGGPFCGVGETRPDGLAARPSAAPPGARAPRLSAATSNADPDATRLAIPARRGVPSPAPPDPVEAPGTDATPRDCRDAPPAEVAPRDPGAGPGTDATPRDSRDARAPRDPGAARETNARPAAEVVAAPARESVAPPVSSTPPVAAPLREAVASAALAGPARRTVAERAALIGAAAAVLFLCCLALGWALLGGAESVAATRAAARPRARRGNAVESRLPTRPRRTAASSSAAPASRPTQTPSPTPATAKPAAPSPTPATAKHAHATSRTPATAKHAAPSPTPATEPERSVRRARHAEPAVHRHGRAATADASAVRDAGSLLCHPEIPPNPYAAMPPSGL